MFAEWAIASALGSPKPRAPAGGPHFATLTLPAPARWRSFLASLALHGAALALLAPVSEFVSAVSPEGWIRRARLIPPVEIRVPERLYLATPGGNRRLPRLRKAVARSRPLPRTALEPAAGQRRLRRFELPPLPVRKSDLTLLQPEFPLDLPVLSDVRLPQVFFWAPVPMTPAARIRRPFILPGHSEPFAQAPRMDALPQLEAPNWETAAALLRVASALKGPQDWLLAPATSMPVRMLQPDPLPPPKTHVAIDRSLGDPTAILALTSSPKPLREELLVPPGNQLGVLPDGFATVERAGTAERAGAAERAATMAKPPAEEPAPSSVARSSAPASGATGRGVEAAPAAAESRVETAATPAEAVPAAGNRGEPEAAPPTALPAGTVQVVHPTNGVFEVVVVHPSAADGPFESSGALSGRPVYSVFLQVGAPKEWILQYCIPGEESQDTTVAGGVVRLGNPAPLTAPYPRVTYLPVLQARPGAHLMIHGFLDPVGHFGGLEVLGAADQEEGKAVLPVLERWEFRPALRDGAPVRVEILLAIPRW
ncbi:MAG: hypothetical protein AAB225_19580 [Acidobacteriota bacterium]